MPSASPPSQEQSFDGLPVPSEEDVQVLYEIVRAAEEHEGIHALPFRALFAAYDQILTQHGINTANDPIYLRFLFKLGEIRRPGQPLYEAFEAFLEKLGIYMEFSDDEDEVGTVRTTASAYDDKDDTATKEVATRSRRASFSSFISFEEENNKEDWSRPSSRASLSRLEDSTAKMSPRRPSIDPRSARREIDNYIQAKRQTALKKENVRPLNHRPKENTTLNKKRNLPQPSSPKARLDQLRNRQQFTSGRNVIAQADRKHPSHENHITPEDLIAAASSMLQSSDYSTPRPEESDPTVTFDIDLQPNGLRMFRDAETFSYFKARDLARNAFWKWREVTVYRRDQRFALERRADYYRQRWLASRMVERWRTITNDNKHVRETERFYARLEKRAVRARDVWILEKAFTHWATCAAEEQERVQVARRHIITLKYYNAWKDITAVNELKIRRFGLGKFFNIWKQKYAATLVFNDRAITMYQENLVETTYWRWFWQFCGLRAPEYHNTRLKKQSLLRWIQKFRDNQQRADSVDKLRIEDFKRRPLRAWLHKLRTNKRQEYEAQQYHRRQLVAHALPEWQMQLKHAPLAHQIVEKVNWRIASGALNKMTTWIRLEQQAAQFDRTRLMRTSFRSWNDDLRLQAMRQQIDDRLVVQALYRWVLAERCALLRRLNEERLQLRKLEAITARLVQIKAQTQQSFEAVVFSRATRLKLAILRRWREEFRNRVQHSRRAAEFEARRLLMSSMESWHIKYAHQNQMVRCSTEALFYLRASHTLNSWREALSQLQKQKLKDAYSDIRRIVKMNLARTIISKWRERTTYIRALTHSADEVLASRVQDVAIQLIPHWRDKLASIQGLTPIAIDTHNNNVIAASLRSWQTRHTIQSEQFAQSTTIAALAVERTAYDALRRLQLRTLEVQSMTARATKIETWNLRRHARAFLRLWLQRAEQKRSPSNPSPLPSVTRSARSTRARRVMDFTRASVSEASSNRTLVPERLQETSRQDFAQSTEQTSPSRLRPRSSADYQDTSWIESPIQPPPSQIPTRSSPRSTAGILSTPSKRAAQARAMIAASYTPATLPGTPRIKVQDAESTDEYHEETTAENQRQLETPLMRTLFRRSDRAIQGSYSEGRTRAVVSRDQDLGQSLQAPPRGRPSDRRGWQRNNNKEDIRDEDIEKSNHGSEFEGDVES